MPPQPPQQQQLQVLADQAIQRGIYSNLAMINHSKEEFVLDFLLVVQGQGSLNSRVILSPAHFKRLVAAIEDGLKKYEASFGVVDAGQSLPVPSTYGFGTPQ